MMNTNNKQTQTTTIKFKGGIAMTDMNNTQTTIKKELNQKIYNLNDENFNFDIFDKFNHTLGDKEYKSLRRKAHCLFKKLNQHDCFNDEACFISSSSLQGFYFPNLSGDLRAISFINGEATPVFDSSR